MKNAIISWWLGIQPPLAVCFDCGKKGLVNRQFANLIAGRVKGRMFTGAGTCVECYTDGEWINAFTKAPDKLSKDLDSFRQGA